MFLWGNEKIDRHLDKLIKKNVEKTTKGRNKVGVTQNDPGCPIPAAFALLSAVGTAHPTGKVSALTIIQTRNQRTEHSFGCHQTAVPWALHRAEKWDMQTPGEVRRTSILPCLHITFLWPWMSSSFLRPHQAWAINLAPLPNEDPKPPAKVVMSLDLTVMNYIWL